MRYETIAMLKVCLRDVFSRRHLSRTASVCGSYGANGHDVLYPKVIPTTRRIYAICRFVSSLAAIFNIFDKKPESSPDLMQTGADEAVSTKLLTFLTQAI
jgi:hypothetical protein